MKNIWKYKEFLPAVSAAEKISLGEGQTPLIRSVTIGASLGLDNLYFKLENISPTGSYKDRFAAVLVNTMLQDGQRVCISTSSGNTGASLAAYCAAARIKCVLAVVDGAPVEKVRQMQLYGADVYIVKNFGIDPVITSSVFNKLENIALRSNIPFPVSAYRYCTKGMMGVQTIAYEIMDDLDREADHIFCPAGGGGLTLAMLKGVKIYQQHHDLLRSPRINCIQPEGNNTIAGSLRNNYGKAGAVSKSTTTISGLQVPGILDGDEVITMSKDNKGNGYVVTDEEVFEWRKKMACEEGIFCEPAGAVSLAGLAKAVQYKEVAKDDKIVCLITGSGFKDLRSIQNSFVLPEPIVVESDELEEIFTSNK